MKWWKVDFECVEGSEKKGTKRSVRNFSGETIEEVIKQTEQVCPVNYIVIGVKLQTRRWDGRYEI